MSGIDLAAASVMAGCAASCGAVLVVAGAGKLYRGARGLDGMTAVRRVLRLRRGQWRLFGLTAGAVECTAGAVLVSGRFPVPGGVALAVLGTVFCALLGYVRVMRIPGGCGCVQWRPGLAKASELPGWRAIGRAGVMAAAGVAYAVAGEGVAPVWSGLGVAPQRDWWFVGGVVMGLLVLLVLSVPGAVGTPRCRRPLWRQRSATLRALARHEAFAAMAGSAGPFGPEVRYRRLGCTDEFWFTPADPGGRAAVFQVRRAARGTRLAVHTSLRDVTAAGADWPARAITLAETGRGYEVARRS